MSDGPRIKHTLLIIGVLLLLAGFAGVAGLRSGLIQEHLFGDPDPSPSIGSAEASGYVASMVPFVLGIVVVLGWGIRNNPIYHELERAKAKEEETAEEDEAIEEMELPGDIEPEHPAEPAAEEYAAEEAREPEAETPEAQPEQAEETQPDTADGPTLDSIPEDLRAELLDSISDIEQELSKIQDTQKQKPEIKRAKKPLILDGEAERKRVERCNKMLSFADMSREDKEQLRVLIDTGISVHDFTEEVKDAVKKRKERKAAEAKKSEPRETPAEQEPDPDLGEADLEDLDLGGADHRKKRPR